MYKRQIHSFSLSLTAAALLPFSFFIAYGVMSIPAGMLVERSGEKPVILAAWVLSLVGSLLVASVPGYRSALVSVFLIGVAMAVLQVAINPLLRVAGGEEHFAFNCALAQLLFGGASFLSPQVYSYVAGALGRPGPRHGLPALLAALTPANWPWVSMYWLFAALSLAIDVYKRQGKCSRAPAAAAGQTGIPASSGCNRTVIRRGTARLSAILSPTLKLPFSFLALLVQIAARSCR